MASDLEHRIRETGLRLYQLIEGESPTVFQKEYWTGKILDWCMRDEAFKLEMFRFVDVFPYLTSSAAVAEHLQEYFSRPGLHFPQIVQWGIKFLSPTSLPARMIARSIAGNMSTMAKQFIVGATPSEALPGLEKLRSQGIAFTVDLLGEAVVSEVEAEAYQSRYIELFDILNEAQRNWKALGTGPGALDWGHTPRINVSIKVSAMYSQTNARAFDHSVATVKERLRPILRKAVATESFVVLDMEDHAMKDLTLATYRSLMEEPEFKGYPHTGIVIQAYLRESAADLEEILRWAETWSHRFTIRLVKGAYWDTEIVQARQKNWPIPVFLNKHETDASYEKLARVILEKHAWVALACASHNIRSLSYVIEQSKELNVPADRVEYQVLYGMGEPVRTALRKAQLPVRVYAPVGEMVQGMAYLVRRLLENTANESFLRQSFFQGVSQQELLRNPSEFFTQTGESGEPAPEALQESHDALFENEPLFDWVKPEHRERFEEVLRNAHKQYPLKVPLFINGKNIPAGNEFHSVNPNAWREIVGVVSAAGRAEAETAVQAAAEALPAWRDTDPRVRAECLFRAAAVTRRLRYDLAALEVHEVGKAWNEADADVCEAIDFMEYYGREMIRLGVPRRMGNVPGEISHLFYEPRGVAAVIAPWNFPLAISAGMTSAAIVTGNTVVFKPASQSPVTGSMLVRIFEEAGLPAGVFNFLPGAGSEIGDYLVTHPEIALIAFTGSREVGLRILELASHFDDGSPCVKNVIAEMGGKNAIIVDSDADLDEAVFQILASAYGYQGQKCSACSRLIVVEEICEKLTERLVAAAESLHLGPVEDPLNVMGAVIGESARKKILEYFQLGKEEGTLLLERYPGDGEGYFVPLAIFTDIEPRSRLAQEEIFGPILSIIKVRDFAQAIDVANGTRYALTGSVFSRSPKNIAKARKEFRTGNLYINRGCTGALVGRHPFGGFKMSGIGSKSGGPDYLLQFTIPRNVVENTLRRGFVPMDEQSE